MPISQIVPAPKSSSFAGFSSAATAWGVSFDGSAAAAPGKVELCETDVAATVTSLTPTKWNDTAVASLCVGGTAATGYTATAEGTITAVRMFDAELVAPTNQFVREFALGREPVLAISKFLRIRVTFAAATNAIAWILWSE